MDQLEEQTPASNPRSFSLAALLLLMTVAAVLAAGGSYFWWATRGQNLSAVGFFGITLGAPLGVAIITAITLKLFGVLKSSDESDGNRRYYG